jgi:hypothetical protein
MSTEKNNLTARCVMLVPLARNEAAHHAAQKFGFQPSIEHEPALAMAELCLHINHLRAIQAWCTEEPVAQLILVHTQELEGIDQLVHAIHTYFPSVLISELRDGRIVDIKNDSAVVDKLTELPIVHSEDIDANELYMLLDNKPHEVEE